VAALGPLVTAALEALAIGAADRGGPLPAGARDTVASWVANSVDELLPDRGIGAEVARPGWAEADLVDGRVAAVDLGESPGR
jgi:L-2,4-diaminobutyrate decarboxylase